jgi:hypothetical protein
MRMDVPPNLVLKQEVPVPPALVWAPLPAPERLISQPKQIPDPAQNLPAPPRLDLPNREIKPAELRVAEMAFASMPALPVPPNANAPVQINGPEQGKQIPQTTSRDADAVASGNVILIPDIPLQAQSLIAIPPANQIALQDAGSGSSSADEHGAVAAAAHGAGSQPGQDSQPHRAASEQGELAGESGAPDLNPANGLTRITLPKDGKFNVVVMGSSASDLYPDSAGLLSGAVVYTVYLHIGLRKNWILEYCLPKGSEQGGAAVDAPWPWLIWRPDELNALDLDYIIVRGDINIEGHFERLSLVYPGELQGRERLLGAVGHWGFRPASRDGQPIEVEALLIIPRQGE